MLNIIKLDGHDAHEFERPLCIIASFPKVSDAANTLKNTEELMNREIESIVEKYQALAEKAEKNMIEVVKSSGVWPFDFNEDTDHLMIKNGVLFYARHNK